MRLRWPIVNPIFARVLRSSGRRARHVWTRVIYLAAILGALAVMMLIDMSGSSGATRLADVGELLFVTVSIVQLVLILFLSPIYTGGAIGQERDAGTFAVLLATPMSNLEIVLGSLLSRLFFVLAILFSTLPLFALLYYFGGFELRDVVLSYAIAAASALVTGAVAVAMSIATVGQRRVMVGFFLFVTGYLVGIYALDHVLLPSTVPSYREGSLDWLHPLGAMLSTLGAGQRERPPLDQLGFGESLVQYPEYGYLLYSIGLSVVIILLSAVFVRRLARRQAPAGRRLWRIAAASAGAVGAIVLANVLFRSGGVLGGTVAFLLVVVPIAAAAVLLSMKRHRKPRPVWDNPIAWRERITRTATSRRTAVQLLYVLLSILALYRVLVMKVAGAPSEDARMFVLYVTTAQAFVVLMVGATMAASCLSYEREQGTLDLLLATPITAKYLIHGKLQGIVRYLGLFLGMMLLVLGGSYLIAQLPVEEVLRPLVPAAWVKAQGSTALGGHVPWHEWPAGSIVFPLIVTGGLAAALVAMGMGFSLKARKTTTAAVHAALAVLGVTAGLTCCGGVVGLIPAVGPVATAISPFLANWASLMSEDCMSSLGHSRDSEAVRMYEQVQLPIGAASALVFYAAFTLRRLRTMVRTFDEQTRQKV